jgi:predicted ribosomally synthesized six-cysteine peptide SCIFF
MKQQSQNNEEKHIIIINNPWQIKEDEKECALCATSCQSACKTSCTVGNIPCEKRR